MCRPITFYIKVLGVNDERLYRKIDDVLIIENKHEKTG